MSTLPNFSGPGYFAGESPDGLTTVAGVPVAAQVQVLWRDSADPEATETLVAQTTSGTNGQWQITGINPDLQYVVRGRKAGFDDVTVVGAVPTRTDIISASGSFITDPDTETIAGEVIVEGGLPPYTFTRLDAEPASIIALAIFSSTSLLIVFLRSLAPLLPLQDFFARYSQAFSSKLNLMCFSSIVGTYSESIRLAIFTKSSSLRLLNTMISSTRAINSGRRNSERAFITFSLDASSDDLPKPRAFSLFAEPALEVITITVFSKFTALPCASVTLPSSRI